MAERVSALAALAKQGHRVLLVSSGAISSGLGLLPKAGKLNETVVELQATSAIGQGRLYHRYYQLFRGHDIITAQILLTSFDIAGRSQYLNARNTLLKLMEWGVIPVINENDTTSTDEIRYGDNDFLAAQVAILVKADRLILLTDTEGLYTSDPSVDPHARLIEEVSDWSALEEIEVGGAVSAMGSGGMKSKVVAAEMATSADIEVVIANGSRSGVIAAVMAGEKVGTRFPPARATISSFKLWLKYGLPSRGTVSVDAGAAKALSRGGKSLLPAGIVGVEGDFAAGEAVDIVHQQGVRRLIGKGKTNYSSEELKRIKGMRSQQVMKLMPCGKEEVIHRDYFVLMEQREGRDSYSDEKD
ncbi:glutamate 5-kinase [bacterium BMS3Abin01]|nr:glutamate 5-kinase [bacterium BMS3Abin01]